MKKRILSMLLVIIMLITTFPITSVASTELSAAEVVKLINDATSYACQASYSINRNCFYTENIDFGSATSSLNSIIQGVDANATLDSVVGGFFEVGERTVNVVDGKLVDNMEITEKSLIKKMFLMSTDVASLSVNDDSYTVKLVNCSNPQKDGNNVLNRATDDFQTTMDVKNLISNTVGSAITVNGCDFKYKSISIVATIKNGIVENLKISYNVDVVLDLKLVVVPAKGTIALQNEITYSNFNYDNVDLPEIPDETEKPIVPSGLSADVVKLINDSTSYASRASYKVRKNGELIEPVDFGNATNAMDHIWQGLSPDWTNAAVFEGLFDIGYETANILDGTESDNVQVYEKHFIKSTRLKDTDIKSVDINENTYTIQLVNCNNPQKDNRNALSRATDCFVTADEIRDYFRQMLGSMYNAMVLEQENFHYSSIVLTFEVDRGVVKNLKISYEIDAIMIMNIGTGTLKAKYEIVYSDFNYENVNLPEIVLDGWIQENGKWAFYENNRKLKNRWLLDSVGWCYVGADGYCLTNSWVKDSVGWCYLDANGRMVCNNWVKDNGKWYFMDANGYMVSNCWKKDSNGWCYLGSSGAMLTNSWVKDSVGWCYVGANGYCVTNKWVKDSTGWCYLDANGRMVYNKWVKDSKGWCYVGSSGYMVYNQWVQTSGKWYYIDASGYMVTGTKVINGKTYKFNSSGVWIG